MSEYEYAASPNLGHRARLTVSGEGGGHRWVWNHLFIFRDQHGGGWQDSGPVDSKVDLGGDIGRGSGRLTKVKVRRRNGNHKSA